MWYCVTPGGILENYTDMWTCVTTWCVVSTSFMYVVAACILAKALAKKGKHGAIVAGFLVAPIWGGAMGFFTGAVPGAAIAGMYHVGPKYAQTRE